MTVLSIAWTALLRLFRDRSNLFFVFILPIALIILIGAQFGASTEPTLGVVAPGGDELVDSVVEILDGEYSIRSYDDRESLVLAVERSAVSAGVEFPDGLMSTVEAGAPAEVGYLTQPGTAGQAVRVAVDSAVADATMPLRAALVVAETQGIGLDEARRIIGDVGGAAGGVDVVRRTSGEALFPDLGQFDLGASTQLVLFMFLTGLTGSAALIQSRQLGVTRRMLASPATVGTIIAGETLGRLAVTLFQGLYIVAVTLVVFRVDWGDPLGAAAVMVVFGLVAAAAAMVVGSLFSNDQQAGGISVVVGLGLAALGGSMAPIEVFSESMQRVARLTPHAWANDAFAELVRRDGSIVDILPQLGVMAGFAVVLMMLATWRLGRVITR